MATTMATFGRRLRLWRNKDTHGPNDCHVKPALVDVSASTLDDGEYFPRDDDDEKNQKPQDSQFCQPKQNPMRRKYFTSSTFFAVGRWSRRNNTPPREERRKLVVVPNKKTTTNNGVVFWSSRTTALAIVYGLLILFLWTGGYRRAIITYGIIWCIATYQLGRVMAPWYTYIFVNDHEAIRSYRYLRNVYKVFLQETNRAISGHNYERQVIAAYLIHAVTAPGESYIAFVIRQKMQFLNHQWMDELDQWQEKRLGYERSRRNVFA
jgi:hypothetical protein